MDQTENGVFPSDEASDHEDCLTCSEEEPMSEDETPTTSDEEFIVSDSEIEREDQLEQLIGDIEKLKKENKFIKKEFKKLYDLVWDLFPSKRKKRKTDK